MTEQTIGNKVKQAIKSQGRTIKWTAEQIGMSASSLSQRIGGTPEFKYSEVEKIKKLLNLDNEFKKNT